VVITDIENYILNSIHLYWLGHQIDCFNKNQSNSSLKKNSQLLFNAHPGQYEDFDMKWSITKVPSVLLSILLWPDLASEFKMTDYHVHTLQNGKRNRGKGKCHTFLGHIVL
jgi:hypothetical protein